MTARNDTSANLPVPLAAALRASAGGGRPDPRVAAQMLGMEGQRRGLRGGAPVLDAARTAYLQAEWSGPADRRLSPGALRATRA